jgi:hypothetical protein
MISYIICKWKEERFETIALPGLKEQCDRFGAELIIVQHPRSIFQAYEMGRNRAKHEIIVYLHEDVALIEPDTSEKIVKYFNENRKVGLLGVLGSMEKDFVPWWNNKTLMGHIVHPNWSLLSRLIPRHRLQYMYTTIN